jgi:iron(III) transport system ATP-binding protein
VQTGEPEALYQHPVDEETALFLGDAVVVTANISGGWATCALGQVAVKNQGLAANARIMLRPEQMQFFSEAQARSDLPSGRVLEADYSGGSTLLTIELNTPSSPNAPCSLPSTIVVRSSHRVVPRAGSTVYVGIEGYAHVLPAPV